MDVIVGGIFFTDRAIFESDIWSDVVKFRLFFYLFGNAVYVRDGITKAGIRIARGQLLKSYRGIREALEYRDGNSIKTYSISTIKRAIDELIKEERISVSETLYGTLFTICNYDRYQDTLRFRTATEHDNGMKDNTLHDDKNETPNRSRTGVEQESNNNNKENKENKNNTPLTPHPPAEKCVEWHKTDIEEMFQYWVNLGLDKSLHFTDVHNLYGFLTPHYKSDVQEAIANYANILRSPDHFYKKTYTFAFFIQRYMAQFLTSTDPYSRYRKNGNGTPAEPLPQKPVPLPDSAYVNEDPPFNPEAVCSKPLRRRKR